MTKGKLYELISNWLDSIEDSCTPYTHIEEKREYIELKLSEFLDKVKKECPILKLIDGYEKYGDEFPTEEIMSKRKLELLIETYKWAKKYFGDSDD